MEDNEKFKLGKVETRMATSVHATESACFILANKEGK